MIVRNAAVTLMLLQLISCQYSINKASNVTVTLHPLRPKGFRAYITADADYSNFLFFDGVIYNNTETAVNSGADIGLIWGSAVRQASGGWLFEDNFVTLTIGTVVRYGIFIPDELPDGSNKNGRASLTLHGNIPDYNIFKVTALEDRDPLCLPTVTKVRGRRVCAGEVIFEDNFDTLREDLWQIEQYIPTDHPEYPFVSYQRLLADENVFILNGKLVIDPKIQEDLLAVQNESILTGSLNFTDGCTRSMCTKVAFGSDILPPIVSGRMTSMPFSFMYGTVYVRAKLPKGDWLYPEILLEPFLKKYGSPKDLANIVNWNLKLHSWYFNFYSTVPYLPSRRFFYFKKEVGHRPRIDERCYQGSRNDISLALFDETASDNFHEYKLQWTQEKIEFSVDNKILLRYHLSDAEWAHRCFEDTFSNTRPNLHNYLHLTLGVGAGGTTVFKDYTVSDAGIRKPWRNGDHKASLRFWQNRDEWYRTWHNPSMEVDYIKVVAL